ncbi:MAG: hypothetical protein ACRDK8_09930 [Solirubrobacteraceae bacterium]
MRDQLLAQRHRGELTAARPRLRFRDAAEAWLAGPVQDLRPRTDECYRNAIDTHLMPRYATMRLDSIRPDDLAGLVRELYVSPRRSPDGRGSVRDVDHRHAGGNDRLPGA